MIVIPTRAKVAVGILVLVLAAGLLTLALLPKATQAKAENAPVQFGPDPIYNPGLLNPCTGEEVAITGEIKGFFQVVQTASGRTYTKFHYVVRGTGVGSEGNSYTFNEIHNQVVPGEPPFTETAQITLISRGAGVNFAINETVHISSNGEAHDVIADPVCRGANATPLPTPSPTATAKAQSRP
jgi:hypothetical protein